MKLNSYPSVYQLGHPQVRDIFEDEVLIEEKVDGSQFSFGVIDGQLLCRSKNAEIIGDPGMFKQGVEYVESIKHKLTPGWQYRGEYLRVSKHNAIAYGRVPNNHIILFDIMVGLEDYMGYTEKEEWAKHLGLEVVPIIFHGKVVTRDHFDSFLERESILGGAKIEGVVIKNYQRFSRDKKFLAGKYVRPDFKELNRAAWSGTNPTKTQLLDKIVTGLKTNARWDKAIQHLRDLGLLEHTPRDIGKLLIEIQADIEKECKEEIMDLLWRDAWPTIKRGVISRFPEYYKEKLMEGSFK